MSKDPHTGDREFTVKRTWSGLTVMVRYWIPDISPGSYCWSRWRKAKLSELNEIIRRLS